MLRSRVVVFSSAVLAALLVSMIAVRAYTTFGRWGALPAVMYINPENADVSQAAAEAALQTMMGVWNAQGGFQFAYGGRTGDTNIGHDGRSVIVFRNEAGGGLAATYAWSVGDSLVEADIVFWDGAYTFFTGSSGCAGGMYIEDVAAHELGHAAGLGHSDDPDATMYPQASSYCSQDWRTLAADDVAALQSLYGGSGSVENTPSTNTVPTVSITAPSNGSSYTEGASIAFAGSATDSQDGDLTWSLRWHSNVDGDIGTGGAFWRVLSPGAHTITATVTDSGGLSKSRQVGITVQTSTSTSPQPKRPNRGSRSKGTK